MDKFFAMGGYAGYVWPAYGIAVLVIGGLALTSLMTYRRTRRALDAAQAGRKRGKGET